MEEFILTSVSFEYKIWNLKSLIKKSLKLEMQIPTLVIIFVKSLEKEKKRKTRLYSEPNLKNATQAR